MDSILVRRADEADRVHIANAVALCYADDFSALSNDSDAIARAIAPGFDVGRFFVAQEDGQVVGVVAVSDCTGRAAAVDSAALRQNLGLIRGFIGTKVLTQEFTKPLSFSADTGFIEFVGVLPSHRGRGIARYMVERAMAQAGYDSYVLDVMSGNAPALAVYTRLGFAEYARYPQRHVKPKGTCRVFMRWTKPKDV